MDYSKLLFRVTMRCTYIETWSVRADNQDEAIKLCNEGDISVNYDRTRGRLDNWNAIIAKVDDRG